MPSYLVDELEQAHIKLRQLLSIDDTTKDILIDSFLQGSYARSTIIKPEANHNPDVDIIAVTTIDRNAVTAKEAFDIVMPFVGDHYPEHKQQNRSIGIFLDKVDVDFVVTASPSEGVMTELKKANLSKAFTVDAMYESATRPNSIGANISKHYNVDEQRIFFESTQMGSSWKAEPLFIPDFDDDKWHETNPLAQISWTHNKNTKCNGYYTSVVKSIKWWKRVAMPGVKHPKSYPLEYFIGDCCPDAIDSIAEGVVKTMETIVKFHPTKPMLYDRGVPCDAEHDVFKKLSVEDYKAFYDAVCGAAPVARAAYDANDVETSVRLWRQFYANCDEFPSFNGPSKGSSDESSNDHKGGFTPRTEKTEAVPTGRFG